MPKTLVAHILLFLVALIYGANYTIAKVVMDDHHLAPIAFIVLRVISATLLFWIFHLALIKERIHRSDLGRIILCAFFGVAINQTFFFSGLKLTTPINASLIMTTTPILVLIASSLLVGERITPWKIAGIIIGATGAGLLIAYGKEVSFNQSRLLGDLLVFINASSYGIYLVLVKGLMVKYNPITVIKWVFSFGFLMVLPFGIGGLASANWAEFTPVIWGAIAYVLLATTFLAYLFNAIALKSVNASVVSIYIYLQPLTATLIALLLGKDHLTLVKLTAGMLIFLGVFLVSTPLQRFRPRHPSVH